MSEIEYDQISHPVIKTTVGAIITTTEDGVTKVLLTRRGYPPYKNYWCLPGGHIDWGESARLAVAREVKEEIGLDLDPRFLFYWDEIIPVMNIHAVVLVFSGPATGNLIAQPGEILEMGWFRFDQFETLSLAFQHNSILRKFKAEHLHISDD